MRQLFFASFWFLSVCSWAQFVPVPQTIRTPHGNVHYNTYIHQPFRFNYGNGSDLPLLFKSTISISFVGDSLFSDRLQYDATGETHVIRKGAGKTAIEYKPTQTKSVTVVLNGQPRIGIPADSCWLFRGDVESITTYSFLPHTPQKPRAVIAIQQGENPIVPLNKENLRAMLPKNDSDLEALVEKGHLMKAIKQFNKRK